MIDQREVQPKANFLPVVSAVASDADGENDGAQSSARGHYAHRGRTFPGIPVRDTIQCGTVT